MQRRRAPDFSFAREAESALAFTRKEQRPAELLIVAQTHGAIRSIDTRPAGERPAGMDGIE